MSDVLGTEGGTPVGDESGADLEIETAAAPNNASEFITTESGNAIGTESGAAILTEGSGLVVAAVAPIVVYSQADFYNRLVRLFPRRWAGAPAFAPPTTPTSGDAGRLYATLLTIAGSLAFLMTSWAYVRAQTRLATATDSYLDLASQDFFAGRLPRRAGELDPAFSLRLRQAIVAPTGCMAAVQNAVNQFFAVTPDPTLIGVEVFDANSDPARAAFYGLQDAQFAIIFYHAITFSNAWLLGRSALGQTTMVRDPSTFMLSQACPYPGLLAAINAVKDWTYRPMFIVSQGEPASLQA